MADKMTRVFTKRCGVDGVRTGVGLTNRGSPNVLSRCLRVFELGIHALELQQARHRVEVVSDFERESVQTGGGVFTRRTRWLPIREALTTGSPGIVTRTREREKVPGLWQDQVVVEVLGVRVRVGIDGIDRGDFVMGNRG